MRYAGLAQDFVIFHFRCSSPRRKPVRGIAPLRLFSRLSLGIAEAQRTDIGGGGRSRTFPPLGNTGNIEEFLTHHTLKTANKLRSCTKVTKSISRLHHATIYLHFSQ